VRLSIKLKSEKHLIFTLSRVPKTTWGYAVLIATVTAQAGGKRDGFCSPVSSNLSSVSLSEMPVQVINFWLDGTPPFSDPSLNLTKAITKSPSSIKSGWLRKVTGRPPPRAFTGGRRVAQAVSLRMALTGSDPVLTHRLTSQPSLSLSPGGCLMARDALVPRRCPASSHLFTNLHAGIKRRKTYRAAEPCAIMHSYSPGTEAGQTQRPRSLLRLSGDVLPLPRARVLTAQVCHPCPGRRGSELKQVAVDLPRA